MKDRRTVRIERIEPIVRIGIASCELPRDIRCTVHDRELTLRYGSATEAGIETDACVVGGCQYVTGSSCLELRHAAELPAADHQLSDKALFGLIGNS